MFNKFLIVMMISALSLYGCGGGGSGSGTTTVTDTPTDTSLVFSIFAPEYLGGSYSVSYSLAGSDTNGDTYTATQTVQSGSTTKYLFKEVKEIIVSTSITNTSTGSPLINMQDKKYFTFGLNNSDLKYYASKIIIDEATYDVRTITNEVIPLTATIGDSGTVGNYTRAGTSFTQSWELTDGFNGKAILVVTTVPDDTSSDLYPTMIEKLLISQDGTVSGYELIITEHPDGKTITLTSL